MLTFSKTGGREHWERKSRNRKEVVNHTSMRFIQPPAEVRGVAIFPMFCDVWANTFHPSWVYPPTLPFPISTRLCGEGMTTARGRSIHYFPAVPTIMLLLLPTTGCRQRQNARHIHMIIRPSRPGFGGNRLATYRTSFRGLWDVKPKIPQNQPFFMVFKIPQFSILFAPENHFFIEVSISTKKTWKLRCRTFRQNSQNKITHSGS